MLERSGFRLLSARDGREAADVFEEHAEAIVCVIPDLTMPRFAPPQFPFLLGVGVGVRGS